MNTPIHVVCAAIHNKQGDILCALRSEKMTLPGYWEFPGGKVEEGELPQNALIREIKEELNCNIVIGLFIEDSIFHYDTFSIRLETFFAEIQNGTEIAMDHSELKWVPWHRLRSLNWAPADITAVERVIEQCKKVYTNN